MDNYKGERFDSALPPGRWICWPSLYDYRPFPFETCTGINRRENDNALLQSPLDNVQSPLDMYAGKKIRVVTKVLLQGGNKESSLCRYLSSLLCADIDDLGRHCGIRGLQYFPCFVRSLGVLNTLMIASEQDNRVLLTEIDLWLHAHINKRFLEVQSSIIQSLSNMLYVSFFLKLRTETWLHPVVADEHLFKFHTYYQFITSVNIEVQV